MLRSRAILAAAVLVAVVAFSPWLVEGNDLCGATITANTTLTHNQVCSGNGITIGASGVELELNGFSIIGPVVVTFGAPGGRCSTASGNFATTGIIVTGQTLVEIKGPGSVEGFGTGILISGGANNVVEDGVGGGVLVTKNFFNGVHLLSTTGNTIQRNHLDLNCGIGVRLDSAHNNSIEDNTCDKNHGPPICGCLFSSVSNNNSVERNTMDQNGDFAALFSASNGNSVEDNVATNSNFFGFPVPGIELISSNGNNVERNVANTNSLGIVLFSSTGNDLEENTALGNTTFDLAEFPDPAPPCPNTWEDNVFVTTNDAPPMCIQ